MRVQVLLSRLWHWWQWYWYFRFDWWGKKILAVFPSSGGGVITFAFLRDLGFRRVLRLVCYLLQVGLLILFHRYFLPTHELIIDRNARITLVSGHAGIYNQTWRCVRVFLSKYLSPSPNYWIVAYHHEILHKVLHHVVGRQACIALDNIDPKCFAEYIGANTHFFTAPTLTYDEWRFGIMRRMSVAGESGVFGG